MGRDNAFDYEATSVKGFTHWRARETRHEQVWTAGRGNLPGIKVLGPAPSPGQLPAFEGNRHVGWRLAPAFFDT